MVKIIDEQKENENFSGMGIEIRRVDLKKARNKGITKLGEKHDCVVHCYSRHADISKSGFFFADYLAAIIVKSLMYFADPLSYVVSSTIDNEK